MSILSWWKPTVEIVVTTDGAIPTTPTWVEFPEIKENTAKLTPTAGATQEAVGEGGDLIDSRNQKTKFQFECDIFVKKGDERPIEDEDGQITDNYCVRLTPEDDTQEGWIMEKTSVSCQESWTSSEGKMLKYIFKGLKPAAGKVLKTYTKAGA